MTAITSASVTRRGDPRAAHRTMTAMKADAKRQIRAEREAQRKQRRVKVTAFSVVAILVLAFAVVSFKPRDTSSARDSGTSEGFRRITAEEMKTLFDRGEITIIDVRDANAYLQGHIPGALQIPVSRIDGETSYLPKDKMIVTYCTCPAEESSGMAVQILAHRGIANAAALQGGLEAWKNRGYPITPN